VWFFDEHDLRPSDMRSALSEQERARAARFVFPRDETRFISRRYCTRRILGEYLSCEAGEVSFVAGAHGKPFLSPAHNSDLQFNLSHSEDIAVLGVAHGLELGVDVERLNPIIEGVAQHFFSRAEITALSTMSPERANLGFYECWTGKEAFVKAHGAGLSIPLSSFDVAFGPGTQSAFLRIDVDEGDDANAWRLWRFEPAPGYVGAVAARTAGQSWELRLRTSG
jgi:4'-phosphopantetheinyl transferase